MGEDYSKGANPPPPPPPHAHLLGLYSDEVKCATVPDETILFMVYCSECHLFCQRGCFSFAACVSCANRSLSLLRSLLLVMT